MGHLCRGDHLRSSPACTTSRSLPSAASLAGFGRVARRSAACWALLARYAPDKPVLRVSSRDTVEAGLPIARPIARDP
jgi:hypothetical protein